jgi:hypothetical protein
MRKGLVSDYDKWNIPVVICDTAKQENKLPELTCPAMPTKSVHIIKNKTSF